MILIRIYVVCVPFIYSKEGNVIILKNNRNFKLGKKGGAKGRTGIRELLLSMNSLK